MPSRSLRLPLYLLVLFLLSSFLNFHRLGERAFYGDEATYASVTKSLVKSGDWFHLHTYDPESPYKAKPPLYFWLSSLAKGLIADGELANRWWSAAFGVGCVLLTCLLGAILFTAETGLVAGLLLATNWRFLLVHGARHGTMDTMVACLALAAILLAWRSRNQRRPTLNWVGIGVITGLMSMTKGLPLGILALGLISLHWWIYGTGTGWARARLPALAALAWLPIVAPWTVFEWLHHGMFAQQIHVAAFFGTLAPGHNQDPWFYLGSVSRSTRSFVLFLPALLVAALLSFRSNKRLEFGLLAIVVVGWITVFSLARAKLGWYAYTVYPLIAIAIAAVTLYPVQTALERRLPARRQVVALGLAALALLAASPEVHALLTRDIPERIGRFRDLRWEIYQAADIPRHPKARFVILDHPEQRADQLWQHYERHEIEGQTKTKDVDLVLKLIAEDGPIVVAVAATAPTYLVRLLHSRFEGEGTRYQNWLHTVFVRGLELELPEGIEMTAERCGPLDPPFSDVESDFPTIHFTSGWRDEASGERWSWGERATVTFSLDPPRSSILWLRARTYRRQRVELELNGHELTPIQGDGRDNTHQRPLPASFLAETNELVFRLPEARIPDRGPAADHGHRLGIRVRSLRIARSPALEEAGH